MLSKFKPGDKVRVVNYGHLIYGVKGNWLSPDFNWATAERGPIDISKEVIGQQGVVTGSYVDLYGAAHQERNYHIYSLTGIAGKSSWYDEAQLELVTS